MTACRTAGGDEVVSTLHHLLHQVAFFGVQSFIDGIGGEIRMAVGVHTIDVESHLITQVVEIRHRTEDADRTGDGGGFGIDIVRSAGDIIASRSSKVSHRHYDRYSLGAHHLQGTPDLLAGIGTATRRVDTEDECLDIILFGNLSDSLHQLRADDTVTFGIRDLALGIEDCHLVLGFRFGAADRSQVGSIDLMIIFATGIDTQNRIHL